VGKLSPIDFHFVSTYGDHWETPALDICLLAESLGSYPQPPPPSVLNAGILPQLLLDPIMPSDFLCVAHIAKSKKDNSNVVDHSNFIKLKKPPSKNILHQETSHSETTIALNAVQIFRLISQLPDTLLPGTSSRRT
jgi:hypothetical protein